MKRYKVILREKKTNYTLTVKGEKPITIVTNGGIDAVIEAEKIARNKSFSLVKEDSRL